MTTTARARLIHGTTAAVAAFGVLVETAVTALGWYPEEQPEGHLYGLNPAGWAGVGPRLADFFSYFTIWSNILVAVVAVMLALDPDRSTRVRRALRLSSLLMITVTALVYCLVLAPSANLTGWTLATTPLVHVLTPLVTVAGFVVAGPRGWIRRGTLVDALAIPAVWVVFMLVRGVVTGVYPYAFADVATHGYAAVAVNIAGVLALAFVLAGAFWALDRALTRRARPRGRHAR